MKHHRLFSLHDCTSTRRCANLEMDQLEDLQFVPLLFAIIALPVCRTSSQATRGDVYYLGLSDSLLSPGAGRGNGISCDSHFSTGRDMSTR
jgi:hypothetical protein